MKVRISSCVIELIQQGAATAAPLEVCGLLFGGEQVARASVTANVAADPRRHFEIDPGALIAALRAERAGEERLAGYWHSHPSGDTLPSVTDAAMAAPDGKLWIIVAGQDVSAWRAGDSGLHGRFARLEIEIA
ncbi:M67 family metallopeptidase [Sphingomonas sp.]|uniref:M67 family metallopeptidase n=1 Tax=Sphingomonas sp. TaxID=28214 RepID=UPI001EB90588|nr:M67 family metallopeptidase [Sphingomonas sp.]MBX3593963.1 M67 family metallopeptidase [Sphingomonas sp.]